MAELKGVKKILTVKWIVKDKKIIKFVEEENDTYKLADNVLNYLDEIKSGVSVNVTIDDKNVIYIAVKEDNAQTSKEESKSDKPKSEEKQTSNTKDEGIAYTIKAISKTRDYYLFEEAGEKEWFTIADNVKSFLKDVKKGDVLEATVEISNDGKKDIKTITFAKVKSVKEPEKERTAEPSKKKSSYRDEDSMDKRTALMQAKDIVVVLIQEKSLEMKKVKEALKDLTKECYEILQSL